MMLVTVRPPMPEDDRDRLTTLMVDRIRAVFADGVLGVALQGSALKGDFVPGYSDFDLHVFVRSDRVAMLDSRTPHMELGLAFQAAIGDVDAVQFGCSSIQIFFVDALNYPADWAPPVPGSTLLVYGELPNLPVLEADEMRRRAAAVVARAPRAANQMVGRILDKPDVKLAPYVRLFGATLKPAVYAAATLQGAPPLEVWTWPLARVLPLVEPVWCSSGGLTAFFAEVWRWEEVRQDPARLREMFRVGYGAIHELCSHATKLSISMEGA